MTIQWANFAYCFVWLYMYMYSDMYIYAASGVHLRGFCLLYYLLALRITIMNTVDSAVASCRLATVPCARSQYRQFARSNATRALVLEDHSSPRALVLEDHSSPRALVLEARALVLEARALATRMTSAYHSRVFFYSRISSA